ncbi:MAG: hypothetical protein ACJ73S_27885 [Mycobacteriales bacterium]
MAGGGLFGLFVGGAGACGGGVGVVAGLVEELGEFLVGVQPVRAGGDGCGGAGLGGCLVDGVLLRAGRRGVVLWQFAGFTGIDRGG